MWRLYLSWEKIDCIIQCWHKCVDYIFDRSHIFLIYFCSFKSLNKYLFLTNVYASQISMHFSSFPSLYLALLPAPIVYTLRMTVVLKRECAQPTYYFITRHCPYDCVYTCVITGRGKNSKVAFIEWTLRTALLQMARRLKRDFTTQLY